MDPVLPERIGRDRRIRALAVTSRAATQADAPLGRRSIRTNSSQAEYEVLQRLRASQRRAHRIRGLPAEVAEAIQGAKMNPAHDHLNALLDESPKEKWPRLRLMAGPTQTVPRKPGALLR